MPRRNFPRAMVRVLNGDSPQEIVMSSDALRIGRGDGNDLVLSNDSVHRHHAEIHRNRDGAFVITDLGGKNTVQVNGQKISHFRTIIHDDILSLGEVRIQFHIVV